MYNLYRSKNIWTCPQLFGQVKNWKTLHIGYLLKFSLCIWIEKSIHTLAIPSTIALNVCSIKPRLETSKRTYCKNPAGPECVWVADKTTFSAVYMDPKSSCNFWITWKNRIKMCKLNDLVNRKWCFFQKLFWYRGATATKASKVNSTSTGR